MGVSETSSNDFWRALITRGPVVFDYDRPSDRIVTRFDCLKCWDIDQRAFMFLDDDWAHCVYCGAKYDRKTIVDLLKIRKEVASGD